jgi:aryl-alcohol dehydrogenase
VGGLIWGQACSGRWSDEAELMTIFLSSIVDRRVAALRTVGSTITHLSPGDAVLLSFASCSRCPSCVSHRTTACVEWQDRNFGRKRSCGFVPGLKDDRGEDIWGSFFGQGTVAGLAVVSASSVSRRRAVRQREGRGGGLMMGMFGCERG